MSEVQMLTLDQAADRLLATLSPVFVMHNRPDGDTCGSAAALLRLCRTLGKPAAAVCIDPIPDRLAFIFKPGEVLPLPLSGAHEIIPVDVASPQQLGLLKNSLTGPYTPVLMIDHHGVGTPFCDCYLEPDAPAAGGLVFKLACRLVERGDLPALPTEVVEACFTALSSDTGCFKFSNATAEAHFLAAQMMQLCPTLDTADINLRLFDSKSLSTLRAEAFAGANLEVSEDGKIAWLTVSAADRADFKLNEEDFETAIDVVRSLRGVEVAFTIKENREGKFKASLRSTGFNVANVAAAFDGGGHDRAAGCAVRGAADIQDAVDRVLAVIRTQQAAQA